LLDLDLVGARNANRDGFTFKATAGHGLKRWVGDLHAIRSRPLVVPVSEMVLRSRAGFQVTLPAIM